MEGSGGRAGPAAPNKDAPKAIPPGTVPKPQRVQLWDVCGKAQAFGEGLRVFGAAGWGLFAGCESLGRCLNPKHRGEEEEEEELRRSSRHGK